MGATFGEKFEQALAEKREQVPGYGLRTLARVMAKDDPAQTEIVRRRLHKYRPPKPGSGAKLITPTEPTRHEIEDAMGLPRDALKPDEQSLAAFEQLLTDLAPFRAVYEVAEMLASGKLVRT